MKQIPILFFLFFILSCDFLDEDCPTCPRESTSVKWTDGLIYYKWHSNFPDENKELVRICMDEFENISSLQFIEIKNTNEVKYFVIIKNGNKNASTVGMKNNAELILVDFNARVLRHELGHIIGLEHEHQREDRKKYIKINWGNIDKDKYFNFVIVHNSLIPETLFEYDRLSIMHYDTNTLSNNGKRTLEFLDGYTYPYTLSKLSDSDNLKIKYLY